MAWIKTIVQSYKWGTRAACCQLQQDEMAGEMRPDMWGHLNTATPKTSPWNYLLLVSVSPPDVEISWGLFPLSFKKKPALKRSKASPGGGWCQGCVCGDRRCCPKCCSQSNSRPRVTSMTSSLTSSCSRCVQKQWWGWAGWGWRQILPLHRRNARLGDKGGKQWAESEIDWFISVGGLIEGRL